MPSPLKFSDVDPNKLGRGRGIYYRRTTVFKGKEFPGGYFSQYLLKRDKARKSKGYELNPIGLPKSSKLLHTTDGYITKVIGKRQQK
jgi:hypothetical protein